MTRTVSPSSAKQSGVKPLMGLALLLSGLGFIVWMVFAGPPLLHREAHALADASIERVAAHPVVIDTLGQPVRRSGFRNYRIKGSGLTSTGTFLVDLRGPKGRAELQILVSKKGGIWAHENTQVSIAGQRAPLLSLHGEDGTTTSTHQDGVSVTTVPGSGQTWSWSEGTENWVLTSDGTLMMSDRANPTRTLTVLREQFHRGAGLGEEEAQEKVRRARARLAELQVLGQSVP